jgi:hypothetical protein
MKGRRPLNRHRGDLNRRSSRLKRIFFEVLKCNFRKGENPMYRKILLTSVGAMALTGSAAFAADLPYRAAPPVYLPPLPIFTWTGLYLGGQVGYAWARNKEVSSTPRNTGLRLPPSMFLPFNLNLQGAIGGAHVDYNLQINQWVVGLESDVNGTSLSKTQLVGALPSIFPGHPPERMFKVRSVPALV